ncbi:succinyl-CoA ligase [ADP-forming] subunit beta [Striga asiatica]|uniref:Succinyl-CoA ligase [ADP-forming] subunit beta n=1 Tax=Striga asiatica TaxID=4170 RepID=A0A5A7QET0_STRAF|nr:succinyl-CoA ligase [ADP-forming] subunit beta [Striga asiatica]
MGSGVVVMVSLSGENLGQRGSFLSHRLLPTSSLHRYFIGLELWALTFNLPGERLGSERKSESPPYVVSSKNGLSESRSGKRQIESKGKGAEKGFGTWKHNSLNSLLSSDGRASSGGQELFPLEKLGLKIA